MPIQLCQQESVKTVVAKCTLGRIVWFYFIYTCCNLMYFQGEGPKNASPEIKVAVSLNY